jgi:hypothetical protein
MSGSLKAYEGRSRVKAQYTKYVIITYYVVPQAAEQILRMPLRKKFKD